MHLKAIGISLLLVLVSAAPAMAGAGLPKIASIQAGPLKATIHNDSPGARIGSNTFTVEMASVPAGHTVELHLVGPGGQTVQVPLKKLVTVAGPEEGHGGSADSHAAPADSHAAPADSHDAKADSHDAKADSHGAPADSHGAPADSHGAPADSHDAPADSHDAPADSHDSEGGAFAARARVTIPAGGTWKAILEIRDAHGEKLTGETAFEVTYGGPNRVFIGVAGALSGGSILVGAILRRRQPSGRQE